MSRSAELNPKAGQTSLAEQGALYCYLDESGNFDFGENGSKYYFQSALTTRNPYPLLEQLQRAKYDLFYSNLPLSKSHASNDYFHATEDAPHTRDRVYGAICSAGIDCSVHYIVVQKDRTPVDRRDSRDFYQMVFKRLLGEAVSRELQKGPCTHLFVLTDRIPVQRHRRAIISSLKKTLRTALDGQGITYTVADMDSKSDFGLQAADYFTWAIHRLWTNDDRRYYRKIVHMLERPTIMYPAPLGEKH